MKLNIGYRTITASDMPFLFRVYASTRTDEVAMMPWADDQKHAFLRHQFDIQNSQYLESYPEADFQVVVVDRVDAGRLYVARGAEEVRIIDISLLPEFRGRGVGGSVVRAILDEAKDRRVVLHVLQSNPAIHLYQRLGFKVAEVVDPYLRMQCLPSSSKDTRRTTR